MQPAGQYLEYFQRLRNFCYFRGCVEDKWRDGYCRKHYHDKRPTSYLYVYAILAKETSPQRVKFGFSNNPKKRIKILEIGCPVALQLLGFVNGARKLEKAIHEHLADFRWHGEWFDYTGEAKRIADLIASGSLIELRHTVFPPEILDTPESKSFEERLAAIAAA